MLDQQVISNIMRMNLTNNESGFEFINKCNSLLKEPILYTKEADKRLLLESVRDMKTLRHGIRQTKKI